MCRPCVNKEHVAEHCVLSVFGEEKKIAFKKGKRRDSEELKQDLNEMNLMIWSFRREKKATGVKQTIER